MSRKNLITLCLALLALLILFFLPKSDSGTTESEVSTSTKNSRSPSKPTRQEEPRLSEFLAPVAEGIRPHPLLLQDALDNGLRYQILTQPNPEQQISLRLVLDVGSFMEDDHERGIAHFLEHLVFNGTAHFPQGRSMEEFQRLGLKTGQHANARTGFEHTVYQLDLPDDSPDSFNSALQFFRDTFDGLLLLEKEIEAERGVVLEELNLRAKKSDRFFDQMKLLVPSTLLATRSPIGIPETISRFSRADFTRFHQKWYTPNRGTLIITGDLDPAKTEDLIHQHFGSLPWRERGPDPRFDTLPLSDSIIGDVQLRATTGRISLRATAPLPEYKTTPAGFRRALLEELIDEMTSIRWQNIIQSGAQFSSQLHTGSYNINHFAQINSCDLSFDQDNYDLDFFLSEWNRLLQNGFLQSELDQASKNLTFTYLKRVEELETHSAATLADRLVTAHRERATFTSPLDDLVRVQLSLRSIQLAECHDLFESKWKNQPILIQQNLSSQNSNVDQTIKTFLLKQSLDFPPRKESPSKKFNYQPTGKKSHLVSQKEYPKLKLTQLTLSNGVYVNLRPTQNASNLVHLRLTFGQGAHSIPIHQPALKTLARYSYQDLGIKGFEKLELEKSLRTHLVDWNYHLNLDHHLLSGTCSQDSLLTQCQLLHAFLIEPGWLTDTRSDYSRNSTARLAKYLRLRTNTLSGYWRTHRYDFLTNSDSRFRQPTVDEIISTKNRDLQNWLKDDLLKHPLELTLTGDFEVDDVVDTIQETFGRLPPRDLNFPPLKNPLAFFTASPQELPKIGQEGSRAFVSFLFHTPGVKNSSILKAQLTLLKDVFKNRVRTHIREKLGLSYAPNVTFTKHDHLGDLNHFSATVPTSVEQVPQVRKAMIEVFESFLTDLITADELERARLPILKWKPLQSSSPSYWAETLKCASRQENLIEDLGNEEETYLKITPKDLQKLSIQIIPNGAREFTLTR